MLIDSHCHLDFPQFEPDIGEILQQCTEQGVDKIVIPGVIAEGWQKILDLAESSPLLYPAIGVHPLFLDRHTTIDLQTMDHLLSCHPEIIAVGEIGLDHHPVDIDREKQLVLFLEQLKIAKRHQRPLLLHVRKAHEAVLQQLRKEDGHVGIVHAFSGSLEQAREYIELGFLIGVGGVATRPNAKKLHRVIREIPLSSIALETDAPDLPPVWAQGKRNSPLQLPAIAEVVATLREEPLETLAEQSSENVRKVLKRLD